MQGHTHKVVISDTVEYHLKFTGKSLSLQYEKHTKMSLKKMLLIHISHSDS